MNSPNALATPPSNAEKLLRLALSTMAPPQKKAFAATLDPLEPTHAVVRFESDNAGRSDADLRKTTTIALAIRIGDRDFIEGLIESPAFVEPPLNFPNQYAMFGYTATYALEEAIAMADAPTLALLDARLADKTHQYMIERAIGVDSRSASTFDCPPALAELARRCDAHPYERVRAACAWIQAKHAQTLVRFEYAGGRSKSSQLEARLLTDALRAKSAQAQLDGMLAVAASHGGRSMARACIELGARPLHSTILAAFSARHFGMAYTLLKLAGSDAHRSQQSEESLARLLQKMGEGLMNYKIFLGKRSKSTENDWAVYDERKADLSACLALAISAQPSDTALLTKARARLLSLAFHFSKTFPDSAQWTKKACAQHPEPHPQEPIELARCGQWSLLNQRLEAALLIAPAQRTAWSSELALVFKSIAPGVDPCIDYLGSQWEFKLAMAMASHGALPGALQAECIQAIAERFDSPCDKHAFCELVAASEKKILAKLTPKAQTSRGRKALSV